MLRLLGPRSRRREGKEETHMSGSFCVSMTAAIGMPKFETGPQKSAVGKGKELAGVDFGESLPVMLVSRDAEKLGPWGAGYTYGLSRHS